jgi:hypothetical protein
MNPIRHFDINHHPTLSNGVAILCLPIERAIATLSLNYIIHLFRLSGPKLTHRTFQEELDGMAPAGGAAAAAPERGALVGPSVPTSTSTW